MALHALKPCEVPVIFISRNEKAHVPGMAILAFETMDSSFLENLSLVLVGNDESGGQPGRRYCPRR